MLNNMWNSKTAIDQHIRQCAHPELPEMLASAFLKSNIKGLRVLNLNLKKCWFDMIASGEKTEEYRQVKPYWVTRLSRKYDAVCFRNGYGKDAPSMLFEVRSISITHGHVKWGAPEFDEVFCIVLGSRIDFAATASSLQE